MTHDTFMPTAWMMPVLIQDTPQGGGLIGGPSSAATTQPGTPGEGGVGAGQNGRPGGGMDMMFLILVLFGGMLLITMFSGRKEKKRRKEMMSSLGKKDKVRTAGGVIGTIVEMKGDEVLIEADRASHTRLWFAKGSISSVEKHAKSSDTTEEETQSTGA